MLYYGQVCCLRATGLRTKQGALLLYDPAEWDWYEEDIQNKKIIYPIIS